MKVNDVLIERTTAKEFRITAINGTTIFADAYKQNKPLNYYRIIDYKDIYKYIVLDRQYKKVSLIIENERGR